MHTFLTSRFGSTDKMTLFLFATGLLSSADASASAERRQHAVLFMASVAFATHNNEHGEKLHPVIQHQALLPLPLDFILILSAFSRTLFLPCSSLQRKNWLQPEGRRRAKSRSQIGNQSQFCSGLLFMNGWKKIGFRRGYPS